MRQDPALKNEDSGKFSLAYRGTVDKRIGSASTGRGAFLNELLQDLRLRSRAAGLPASLRSPSPRRSFLDSPIPMNRITVTPAVLAFHSTSVRNMIFQSASDETPSR